MTKIQRYKVGFFSDEWGMSSITPCLIPDDSGFAVKFEDYCKLETELAALKAELEEENTALVKTIQRDTLTSLRRLAELKALKAELREICAAIDDPACDLTLTAVECIKKLKAENESLKRDTERYQWLKNNNSPIGIYSNADFDDCYYIHEPDETIDKAMSQGEQG